ncbi:MAG: tRNA preQ1(34) S-adenosylmethionine ribosyltransferase-isomerase QueA, partial [Actinomycetes bacterium]
FIEPGDLIVVNTTRVLRARVAVRRPGGGDGEVLLLEPASDGWWTALCRPSRRMHPSTTVVAQRGSLAIEMGEVLADGRRMVRPVAPDSASPQWLLDALDSSGEMPLPPYIGERLDDDDRYQTVFAERPASAAAPTAGLHLTTDVIDRCRATGARFASVELVVGLDTFRPIDTDDVEAHPIHTESFEVPDHTWEAVQETRERGGRVVAVGTTSVRSLETRARTGASSGRTDLFITPGFEFAVVDVLLTNFHLPRSSLLALVQAFCGPHWRDLYAVALERGYRFLSFGDTSLLMRAGTSPVTGSEAAR